MHFKVECRMYERKLLVPEFDLRAFAKEYDRSEISVSGYDVVPEALEYMRGIASCYQ
ncbi:hypothetical protein MO867_19250 [Microbulbifer sp. OS29]|uniref:DUF6892 domain-containing protein n=1 Tax=Microbulbifer okhotskensis TaxID=2926617 RepID=A0A9X2EQD1_9GAMM|nr:hypothetical protein [Microbulbifer okhotskensis]MCO1336472.1 hypothetical protein [Microbulbifer okhotskensis]